tara:strand:- start:701 stop:1747 length:1047 start_codon:yes stop_codon:yes gene_type:complete
MKRILVTGGCGYIGSHTSVLLLDRGYELLILDSNINSSPRSIDRILSVIDSKRPGSFDKLKFIKGDVRDIELLKSIFFNAKKEMNEIDGIIHFSGLKAVGESVKKPLLYWDSNVNGIINLLKVMDSYDCRTIIFSSSATIYSTGNDFPISEDCEIKPINPYGNTKATAEKILNDLFNSDSQSWRIANLRYFNPIGAHHSGLLGEEPLGIPNNIFPIINKVASGKLKELQIYGNDWDTIDGTCIRDYIHVMDLAEGHFQALNHLLRKGPQLLNLNLGTGTGTTVLNLVKTFERVNNVKVPYKFTSRRDGDVAKLIADNSLANKKLNWLPSRNLEDMCRDGWTWENSQYH